MNNRKRRTIPALILLMVVISVISGCAKSDKKQKNKEPVTIDITPIVTPDVSPTPTGLTPDSSTQGDGEATDVEPTKPVVDFDKVTPIDPSKTMYAVSNVNVRMGPSTDFESIGMIRLGESIEAIGQDEGGWYEFEYKGHTVFACDDYLSDEEPAMPTPEEKEDKKDESSEAGEAAQVADGTQTDLNELDKLIAEMSAMEEATETAAPVEPSDVLIIGDSRSVMMKNATGGGGCSWICKIGKGYKWFESTAIPEADTMIGEGTRVVIALGVNDIGNVNKYARLVNAKAEEWAAKGAVTYFVSVNPVQNITRVTEDQVVFFNSVIQSQLVNVRWIDTHSYLMNNGYVLTDGLHFDNATSKAVFQVIMSSL